MGAPAHSLGNLLGCAEALREATKGQYSKGIKAAIKAMENAKLDYKATIDRVAEASKWKEGMIKDWINKGELACGDLMEKAEEVLKEAEKREEAEAKIWIMEGQCEELADLATQAGKQVPAEAKVEVLEELEEEIDQRKEMVGTWAVP
jgi:polyhydroxyalkanoate synthesis regulator phasin